jgi:hypothetical protein
MVLVDVYFLGEYILGLTNEVESSDSHVDSGWRMLGSGFSM